MPTLEQVAILHYVGRDKPWQRLDRSGSTPDTADSMCRRLRSQDGETCRTYHIVQALWWREFGRGACVLVGEEARGAAQGFVIEQFELILCAAPPSVRATSHLHE